MFNWFKKKTYFVTYRRYALGTPQDFTTFIKAKDLADIQKRIEEKESPWHIELLSVRIAK